MDVVGREYVAEAGCIVSLCGKGKYGNIYKVDGIVIIDKIFDTKNVAIDSFLDIASRGYKDPKLKQMNLFLNNFNEAIVLKEMNSERITFWRDGYEYYYIKFGDLGYLGVEIDRYPYDKRYYYIVGRNRERQNEFVVINPVFSVICDNKLIAKPRFPVMRIELQGSYLDIMYYHNKVEFVPPNSSIISRVPNNSYLSFKLHNGKVWDISDYCSLFGNRKHFSLNLSEYSTVEGEFVGLYGVYTLIKSASIPEALILPKDCKVLILGENLARKASRLRMCTSIVLNLNLTSIRNGHLGDSLLDYAKNLDTIYLSSKLSKDIMIKLILELSACELKDIIDFKYKHLTVYNDIITLDNLKKFLNYKFKRGIDIKLY